MGNYIASTVSDVQERGMDTMMKRQFQMQCRAQERMRRMQVAQQVAIARERVWWFATALSGLSYGVFQYARAAGYFPRAALLPIGALTLVTAYQFDFAYGSKPERIDRIFRRITDEHSSTYWFVPVVPEETPEVD